MKFGFSISATSRKPRGSERNGVEYYFLTPEEFKAKIANDEFVEYEEVYKDQFYGTLKSEVDRKLTEGDVMFDIDVKGAMNIKKIYGNKAVSIFIQPPSVEELSRRLHGRGTETEEVIAGRMKRAIEEADIVDKYEYILFNINFFIFVYIF